MAKPIPETLLKDHPVSREDIPAIPQHIFELWEPPNTQIVVEKLRYHLFDQNKGFSVNLKQKTALNGNNY